MISTDVGSVMKGDTSKGLSLSAQEQLKQFLNQTSAAGIPFRFWGTPDSPTLWKQLYDSGVDLIGADDLPGLQKFLLSTRHP